jgi:hypothetical protein
MSGICGACSTVAAIWRLSKYVRETTRKRERKEEGEEDGR